MPYVLTLDQDLGLAELIHSFCERLTREAEHNIAIVGTNGLGKSSMLNILLAVTDSIFLRLQPGEKGLVVGPASGSAGDAAAGCESMPYVLEGYRAVQARAALAQRMLAARESKAQKATAAIHDQSTSTDETIRSSSPEYFDPTKCYTDSDFSDADEPVPARGSPLHAPSTSASVDSAAAATSVRVSACDQSMSAAVGMEALPERKHSYPAAVAMDTLDDAVLPADTVEWVTAPLVATDQSQTKPPPSKKPHAPAESLSSTFVNFLLPTSYVLRGCRGSHGASFYESSASGCNVLKGVRVCMCVRLCV